LAPDVRALCEERDGSAAASYRKLVDALEQEARAPTPAGAEALPDGSMKFVW